MKVLFILEFFPPYHGGVEKLFYHLTKTLASKSIEVTVLTAAYDGAPLEEVQNRVRIIRIKSKNRYHFSFKAIRFAIKLAKNHDIIHSSTYNASLPAWVASKIASKPIVLTVHEYWDEIWWRLPFLNTLQRVVFWSLEQFIIMLPYNKIVGVSSYTAERLKKRLPKRSVSTIYNGQRPIKRSPKHVQGDYYLYVGRLGVSKGIDILAEAIVLSSRSNKNLKFKLVIATSPDRIYRYLTQTIESSKFNNKIELFHYIPDNDLFDLMQNAKAIIIPSYAEGFGFVAAEATSLGTPIIHSGKGALNEVAGGRILCFKEYSSEGLLKAILEAEQNKFQFKNPIDFSIEDAAEQYLMHYTFLTES